MCLILLAYKASAEWPLVVASNRDEAYSRPTQVAQFWADAPHVLGGRDLEKGGTWMGVDLNGRFAAVTNFRQGLAQQDAPKSRGELVAHYLREQTPAHQYLQWVNDEHEQYAGFSAIMGHVKALYFYSNRARLIKPLEPGVHGLSNALLDTPWPKVNSGKEELSRLIFEEKTSHSDSFFEMLLDQSTYDAALLPHTGIEPHREKALSAKFIAQDERYGTRSSTVIRVHCSGLVHYAERSYAPWGLCTNAIEYSFQLNTSTSV